jgi:hypothetical protein
MEQLEEMFLLKLKDKDEKIKQLNEQIAKLQKVPPTLNYAAYFKETKKSAEQVILITKLKQEIKDVRWK